MDARRLSNAPHAPSRSESRSETPGSGAVSSRLATVGGWIRALFGGKSSPTSNQFRPSLESLEEKILPTSVPLLDAMGAEIGSIPSDTAGALQKAATLHDLAATETDTLSKAFTDAFADWEGDLHVDASLRSRHENTRSSLLGSLATVTSYESQVAAAMRSLADAQASLDAAQASLTTNQAALDAATRSYQAKQANVAALEQKLTDAKNAYAALLPSVYASDLYVPASANGWGVFERDRSNGETGPADGRLESIRGVTYAKGLGVHANSSIDIPASGQFATFESVIGIDDETKGAGSAVFQVWGDGKKLFDSGIMTGTMPGRSISVDVRGVQKVQLVVTNAGDNSVSDNADWANARFTYPDTGTARSIRATDLFIQSSQNALGPAERNMSNGGAGTLDGRTMAVNGVSYANGLGVKTASSLTFRTDARYSRFQGLVGVDAETKGNAGAVFQVWGDGKKLFDSGVMTTKNAAKSFSVNVAGVKSVVLVALSADGRTAVSADWINPQFILADNGLSAARASVTDTDTKLRAAKTDLANDKQVPTAQAALDAAKAGVQSAQSRVTGAGTVLQEAKTALTAAQTSRAALDAAFASEAAAIDALPSPQERIALSMQESLGTVGMQWSPGDLSIPRSLADLFHTLSAEELAREERETREKAEILEGLRLGDRIAVAYAYDQFVATAADMPRLIAETQKMIADSYLTPTWYRDQMWQIGVQRARGNLERYETLLRESQHGIAMCKAILATTPETLPTAPRLDVLGVSQNKLVVQAYAPDAKNMEFVVSWNAGDRYGMQTLMTVPATTSPDMALPVGVIPFNGLMGGSVEANRSQKYEVRLVVDGRPGPTVWVEWYPASRGLGVHWETTSLSDTSVPVPAGTFPEPAAGELAQIRDFSSVLSAHVAPYYAPISINNGAVAANVPYSVWSATGLSSIIATSFLEDSREALVKRDYASLLATGWKPGEVDWDNAWKAVYHASEDLVHAANDYAGYLIAKNAGYEVGSFDFSRLDKGSFPLFPTKDQVKTAVETHFLQIYQAIQGRQAEDVAFQQMLENQWRRFYVASGQAQIDQDKEDAKMLGSAARAGASQEILISMAKSLGPGALQQALTGGVSWIRSQDIAALQTVQTAMVQPVLLGMGGSIVLSPEENSEFLASLMTDTKTNGIQTSLPTYETLRKSLNQALSDNTMTLVDMQKDVLTYFADVPVTFDGVHLRTDTIVGRMVASFFHSATQASDSTKRLLAVELERMIGVPAEILYLTLYPAKKDGDFARSFSALKKYCSDAGFGSLFYGPEPAPIQPPVPTVAYVKVGEVNTTGGYLPVTFDVQLPPNFSQSQSLYETASVYLLTESGLQIGSGDKPLLYGFKDGYTIHVPLSALHVAAINDHLTGSFKIKLALFAPGNTGSGMPGNREASFYINVDLPTLSSSSDLSTLPEGDPNRNIENILLNQLKQNFPLGNMKDWKWDIGSDYHYGKNYDAVDLNKVDRTHEKGFPVFTPVSGDIEGTIMDVGSKYASDYGVIRIQYETLIAGKEVKWFVEYLHLLVNDTGKKDASGKSIFEARDKDGNQIWTFVPGVTKVKGSVQVGGVGGRGEGQDDYYEDHLHMKLGFIDANGKEQSVDMRQLLSQELNSVIASDAGPDGKVGTSGDNVSSSVVWDSKVNAWIPKERTGVLAGVLYSHLNQEDATGRTPGYWYAWEAGKDFDKMERVVWESAGIDVVSKKEKFTWISVNPVSGSRSVWREKDGKFSFISLSLYKTEQQLQ